MFCFLFGFLALVWLSIWSALSLAARLRGVANACQREWKESMIMYVVVAAFFVSLTVARSFIVRRDRGDAWYNNKSQTQSHLALDEEEP